MTTTLSKLATPVIQYVPNFVKNGFEKAGVYGGHFFSLIQGTPRIMNQNNYVATAVCLLINSGLYFGVHHLANRLDSISNSMPPKLNEQKKVKQFLINTVFVGGLVLTANTALSSAVNYQMNKFALVGWTVAAIALRYHSDSNQKDISKV